MNKILLEFLGEFVGVLIWTTIIFIGVSAVIGSWKLLEFILLL